jgi:hypothetical protein
MLQSAPQLPPSAPPAPPPLRDAVNWRLVTLYPD